MRRSRSAPMACAFATAVLAVSFCAHSAWSAEERPAAAHAEARWDKQGIDLAKLFDAVVDTVDKKFFDEALLKQLDWRGRANAVRPSVVAAATPEDAVRQINALLAELKTSHTGLFTPDDYEYYIFLDVLSDSVGTRADGSDLMSKRFWGTGPFYPGIGAFTRRIDGHDFIDGILEGSPAERAGLKYGDEILSVDGTPYSPIAVFHGKIGRTVELEIRRSEGAAPQRLDVPVIPIRPTSVFAAATTASARVIERDGVRIGYVHIWASNQSVAFKAALARLEPRNIVQERLRASGVAIIPNRMTDETREMLKPPKPLDFLIVDIRGRVGGNVAVASQHLESLDAKDYFGSWRTMNRSDAGMRVGPGDPRNPPFRGRSALLIDHHTRSAAELMAHGYKRSAFGPVIGTPTAGAVSSGALSVMPGDLLLYVAVVGHEHDGQRLEGVGVSPHHRVERPLPYAAGADPVLDAAVHLLAKQAPK
jgi:carboxyl-terminal processing protease